MGEGQIHEWKLKDSDAIGPRPFKNFLLLSERRKKYHEQLHVKKGKSVDICYASFNANPKIRANGRRL